ncbi:TIGR03757 family integrating conjugative element protein [sulfur-oxidizing endosymbiont of Gigantopelta aegis]|uniref:TIGR03757 family integrating conjugative element protein n=1 Tax=sulfur-oxidizing endosymbiont of Gigantopelta aegis TaxID=2794934 RepID=UPI0018DD9B87|nr:TIGR03757 family integrating conjugative element protein [sulfur-oxidizing endosymbiont of Gigantopelta aegis]
MKCRLLISIAILVLSQFFSIGVWAQQLEVLPELIWIFDNDVKPVRYQRLSQLHPVKHFNLDQTKKFEQQFSLGLSGSSNVASQQALQRIQNLTPSQMEQFKQAYSGIVTAWQMGVKKLPAVVFQYQEQQYVVYGQQRASIALQEFQQWQQNH